MKKISFKGSAMLNPVPVVLVTSVDEKSNPNVFTVAWAGTACTKPPLITISVRPERLSYSNIKVSQEFVVNIPSKTLVKEVDYCGVVSGKKEDKIKKMNFTLVSPNKVNVPLIEECPLNLECRVKDIIPLGTHHLFISEVLSVHVDEALIDSKGKIHYEKADLLSYCHGEYYPLPSKSLGKFGFSVMKRRKKNSSK